MKLTIIRLTTLRQQDCIDLGKIWPNYPERLNLPDENHRIYAARFNQRLLGAVRVRLENHSAWLEALNVREVTRRRGVGFYLMREVLADNAHIKRWEMSAAGIEKRSVMDAFMVAVGFEVLPWGWLKQY